jgi:hypothetical protein
VDLQDFCARLYDLTAVDKPIAAVDALVDRVDRQLRTGEFAEVDALLKVLDLECIPTSAVTGLLTLLSHVPPGKLKRLPDFLKHVRFYADEVERETARDRLHTLLLGFKVPKRLGWMERWYELVEQGARDEAGDLLFEKIADLFSRGQFKQVDTFLKKVHLYSLDTYAIVSVLSVTYSARDKLVERSTFAAQARKRLEEIDLDRVNALMDGLE